MDILFVLIAFIRWSSREKKSGKKKRQKESGGFLQVSGMTYEIDVNIPSSCTSDENGLFTGISGERRVKNVMVGGEPIDPEKMYTLAGEDYRLQHQGDGLTVFRPEDVIRNVMIDNAALMKYVQETLGGVVGEEYADPYGQGRIVAAE